MSTPHLVQMANDIGNFFRAEPLREDAVGGILNHIEKYWTRRMQEKLIEHLRHDGTGLDELPQEAVLRLAARASGPPMPGRSASR
ncbi:MAG: formate dehydrogenase subunit delta [Steroidobacteraceae bacterium]|jgi:formate dehydrogenase subunit delta